MKTLLAATGSTLVFDDGIPIGNRTTTVLTLMIPLELEWAPQRGGIVVRGHRITVSQIYKCHEVLKWSPGYIAGCYGLEEAQVVAAIRFCDAHPECVEPEDEDAGWWLDVG